MVDSARWTVIGGWWAVDSGRWMVECNPSSLMPLLALLVERRHVAQYGSVYAIGAALHPTHPQHTPHTLHPPWPAQTAVALAYSLGPLSGGYLVQSIGFKVSPAPRPPATSRP